MKQMFHRLKEDNSSLPYSCDFGEFNVQYKQNKKINGLSMEGIAILDSTRYQTRVANCG